VRNIGSFQQAFAEMAKGEDFVLKELTARARERQRWRDAPILLAASILGLWLLLPSQWRTWWTGLRRRRARFPRRH
jgi:zinc/manganese transport system permease protein